MANNSTGIPSPLPPSPFPPSPSPSPPPPVEEEPKDLWYIGAIINVVGSVSINLGMNLMKLGHTKRAMLEMPEEEKPPIRKFKVWIIGIICFTVGNVLNFVSFAFAAQSLLSALGSLQLVCNVFFAYFVNHEPITIVTILSTGCIIGGCVILVIFGNQSSETYTVDELIDLYKKPAYVVYLVMMVVFVFGFYVLYLHSKKVCRARGERGIWYAMMLVSYAIYSALLGSQSVLFGKSISVILRTTFTESNQLGNWYTWVVLPCFLFTALFYVTRMNKGLRMFPAMIIVPLLQIAWTLFSIVSGMLYFQEYKGFTTLNAIMFAVGVMIVFLGVFVLTVCGGGRRRKAEEESEEAEAEKAALEGGKMAVHDNAIFNGDATSAEPTPVQEPKMSLGQTLRFTSTWAPPSVAVSPASNMNRTLMTNESLRRQRRMTGAASDLNASIRTNDELPYAYHSHHPGEAPWKNSTFDDKNSTLNRTGVSTTSRISETSMMNTMRTKMKKAQHRITNDLGVETISGLKLAAGFGGSEVTGVSVFAMPMVDFTATTKRGSKTGPSMPATAQHSIASNEAAILSALPKSKFHKADQDALTTIREGSGIPTAKPTASELGSYTASSHHPGSSQGGDDFQGQGGSSSSPETGRRTASKQSGGTSTPVVHASRSPSKPLETGAILGLLPGPAFKMSRVETDGGGGPSGGGGSDTEPGNAAAPSGAAVLPVPRSKSVRLAAVPEGSVPLPGFRTGSVAPSSTGYDPAAASDVSGSHPNARAQVDSSGGGASRGGAVSGGGAQPADAGSTPGRRQLSRQGAGGGLGSVLPEGVPLSSANSVILHDSRPSTPPEVMLGQGGAGISAAVPLSQIPSGVAPPFNPALGYAGVSRSQSQAQGLHRLASPQRPQQLQQPQLPLQPQLQQQQQTLQQVPSMASIPSSGSPQQLLPPQPASIPISLLHRVQTPPMSNVRLPPLHLMVPGMPMGPPPQAHIMGITHQSAGGAAGGSVTLAAPPPSMSYAQMLSARVPADRVQPLNLAHSTSMGGALPAGMPMMGAGMAAPPVLVQSRPRSPHGLSVSRSWAGLGGQVPGGGAGQRQSPLRGSGLVAQMQRPLRPWQQY